MVVDDFLTYIAGERRYSPLTVRNYRRDIDSFVEYFMRSREAFDPAAVTTKDVREWICFRTGECKISARSMNRELSSLRTFFRYCRSRGVASKDIFRNISALKTPRRLPAFVPESRTADMLETLDDECNGDFVEHRNAVIILMFYFCGLRLSELTSLKIGSFNADYTSLRVVGKGNKERAIPIARYLRSRLVEYISALKEQNICISAEKALFLTLKGEPVSRSSVYRIVRRELEATGMQGRRSPHVLRHTFATHLLNKGADMREIQELMGHGSLGTTQIYTHNSITNLQSIYARAHPHAAKHEE